VSDIPDDLLSIARKLTDDHCGCAPGRRRQNGTSHSDGCNAQTAEIARAIMAERERCAAVADAANAHYASLQAGAKAGKDPAKARDFESMRIAAGGLASDIRKGGQ
jgi:hypothetical protein